MPNAPGRTRRLSWVAVSVLVVAVALAATSSSGSRAGKPLVSEPKQALSPVTTGAPAATIPVATTAPHTPSPLTVIKVTPRNHANGVGFRTRVVVTYSRPPALDAPVPTIEPRMSGLWDQSGDRLEFVPTGDWALDTTYRVTVPVNETNPGDGPMVVKFTTGLPSVLMLQQYLAILGYLPLRFTPTGEVANRRAVLGENRRRPTLAGRPDGGDILMGVPRYARLAPGPMARRPTQRGNDGGGNAVRGGRGLGPRGWQAPPCGTPSCMR